MSPVTSYNLWWDEGSNGEFWYSLIGINEPVLTQTLFTVTNNILEGQYYKFKVRAKNIWGWGAFSPEVTIRASTIPSVVIPVTTSYDVTGGVKIAWAQTKNNGDPIYKYKIQIFSYSTSTWNEETTNCNGADSLIVLRRYCVIPVSQFYYSPYSLTFNQFIRVRVQAKNVIDWGDFGENSQAVSDTRLKSKALNMWSPYRGEATSVNKIEVKWNELLPPDNGNAPVLSYNLVWDANTGDCTKDLIGLEIPYLSLSYIVTQGLEFDRTYCFKVRALNTYGWGEWSIVSYISTSDNPGQMEVVLTQSIYDPIDTVQKVRFKWVEPLANGEFITKYHIKIMKNDGLGSTYLEELTDCDASKS